MRTKMNKSKKGFTLIELMLAVAFLGTLLLSVAMLAMRLVNMYTKGATMRAVNSVGSAIVDDVRSHVTSSNLWSESFEEGPTKEDQDKLLLVRKRNLSIMVLFVRILIPISLTTKQLC